MRFMETPFVCFSLTGSGSVTVESVQRHSSSRQRSSDDGQMDFSLTAIDLPALRLRLSGVITSNKDRWKELSVHGTHTHPHTRKHTHALYRRDQFLALRFNGRWSVEDSDELLTDWLVNRFPCVCLFAQSWKISCRKNKRTWRAALT